jgi:hypothetical protein
MGLCSSTPKRQSPSGGATASLAAFSAAKGEEFQELSLRQSFNARRRTSVRLHTKAERNQINGTHALVIMHVDEKSH